MMSKVLPKASSRQAKASLDTKMSDTRRLFSAFDRDASGFIDAREIKTTMKQLGIVLSERDVEAMIKEAGGESNRIYFEGNINDYGHL